MADNIVVVLQQTLKPIKVVKWKVNEGNSVSIGCVVLLYEINEDDKHITCKLKSTKAGTVHKLLVTEGDVVKPGDGLFELQACLHPTVMRDMCAECGADLRKEDINATSASVPMIHSVPDLKVSLEQAQKIGKQDVNRLLKDRKLVLLVDLDQTLIHTTNDNIPANIKDVYHFQLYGPHSPWYHTRLRPGTHRFLENMSPYFELHICTFGARNYAHMIALFLDQEGKLFSQRILSRDECFNPTSKTANLKALFPCGDDLVCIIDDREDVWSYAANLIHVKPYHFFQHTGDINAPPGLDKHESDEKEGVDLTKVNKKKKVKINGTLNNKQEETESIKEKQLDSQTNDVNKASDNDEETKDLKEQENNTEKQKNDEATEASDKEEVKQSKVQDNGVEKTSDNMKIQMNIEKSDNTEEISEKEELQQIKKEENDLDKTIKKEESKQMHVQENNVEKQMNNEKIEEKEVNIEKNDSDKEELQQIKVQEEVIKNNGETKEENKEAIEEDEESENSEKQTENLNQSKDEELIEIEDQDDYLLYLEDILKLIHNTFYDKYDKMETGKVPDLKKVIPEVRRNVLKDTKLVFSGLVPTHIKLEQSKAYQVARSLGATVTQDLEEGTTHLVAVRPGTAKVNAGRRKRNLKIVTPDWLWACAERWTKVEEKLYTLNNKGSKNRHPPPHCSSPEHNPSFDDIQDTPTRKRTASGRFMDTINPLMSFSSADIADMDREVEDIFNESESEGESSKKTTDKDFEDVFLEDLQPKLKASDDESSSSSDESLTGEHPHGWRPTDNTRKRSRDEDFDDESTADESPSTKFRRGEQLSSDLDIGQESNSEGSAEAPDEIDDGDWNMMGAALEREFLANN